MLLLLALSVMCGCRSVLFHSLEGAREPDSSLSTSGMPAAEKVKELSKSLQEGPDSRRNLDKIKSIGSRSLNRGLNNVSCGIAAAA